MVFWLSWLTCFGFQLLDLITYHAEVSLSYTTPALLFDLPSNQVNVFSLPYMSFAGFLR